jgi:hypothetical protein
MRCSDPGHRAPNRPAFARKAPWRFVSIAEAKNVRAGDRLVLLAILGRRARILRAFSQRRRARAAERLGSRRSVPEHGATTWVGNNDANIFPTFRWLDNAVPCLEAEESTPNAIKLDVHMTNQFFIRKRHSSDPTPRGRAE